MSITTIRKNFIETLFESENDVYAILRFPFGRQLLTDHIKSGMNVGDKRAAEIIEHLDARSSESVLNQLIDDWETEKQKLLRDSTGPFRLISSLW